MKFAHTFRLLLIATALPIFTLQPLSLAAEAPAGIRLFISNWDKAWAHHDPNALGMLHTEDAITVNRYGTFLRGRQEIKTRLAFLLTNGGPLSQVAFPEQHIMSVRLIQPQVAIVQTEWQSPEIGRDGKVLLNSVDRMILTYVLVRSGPEWKASEVDTHDVVESMQH